MNEVAQKIKDLEEELNLPKEEFEKKLAERLREEVKINRIQFDEEMKKTFLEEKKRISQ